MFSIINMVNEGNQIKMLLLIININKKYDISFLYIHTFTDMI